ncbi:FxsA family protein [Porticoccaceae bacterium LTM1]|nr:FxsA family protein [Porticoccaceae bacterium LTM1]
MRALLLLFIVMPIVEMWLLIEVGGVIGAAPTIGLVLLTAAIGFAMLRKQGFDTLSRSNLKMQRGELPAQEMVEGLMLAVSGALLLTPGFVTDAIGFAGLTPAFRRWLFKKLSTRMTVTSHTSWQGGQVYEHRTETKSSRNDSNVLEGDYRRED